MKDQIKRFLRKYLKLDVRIYKPRSNEFLRLSKMLEVYGVRLVLDIGANEGQFAADLRRAGYDGEIVSFEPLPDAHRILSGKVGGTWRVGPRVAVSDADGTANFEINGHRVSSSLLHATETLSDAAPHSGLEETIEVPTRRLDTLWSELGLGGPAFLKIDAQGAESMILSGAGDLLAGPILGVQIELPLVEMYRGQTLSVRLDEQLRSMGFRCVDIIPGFRHPETHVLLEYDGVYFRS
jgi:FkbM family methyltransferase